MSEQTNETATFDETSESSFAQELFKTASVNAAATAGTLVGLVAIALSVDKVREYRTKRAAKKAAALQTATSTEA